MATTIPEPLFVLEMANNHMGDVEHGIAMIGAFAEVCSRFPFRCAFKMQYRQLDSFIHPDYRQRMDIMYVKRFSETRLSRTDTKRLVAAIKDNHFLAMCTPFDPESVDLIVEDGFDIIKIASCSFTDWPLLEKMVTTDLPIIGSTAGVSLIDMDSVVSFMAHRKKQFALMHCVAEYPTTSDKLQLNQIDLLQQRYPHLNIGFSTHEVPEETSTIGMAIAKGCTLFEKHVALPNGTYAANAYSATPQQVHHWLQAAQKAFSIMGVANERIQPTEKEAASLISLRRGVFAKHDIQAGQRIGNNDVFMAIPTQPQHITANDWSKYTQFHATRTIRQGEALQTENTQMRPMQQQVYAIVQQVKNLLKDGNIIVPGGAELEISHHYGIERFHEVGISMITVVNRLYCKKLIAILSGQSHPEQYHKQKEETFHILHGQVDMILDGQAQRHGPGSVVTIDKGVKHAFSSRDGAVLEEISSTHWVDDSFYTDPGIAANPNRKTFISFWM